MLQSDNKSNSLGSSDGQGLMCCLQAQDKWRGEVVELSWEPRAFLFKKFMTDEECDSIIAKVSC